MSRSGFDLLFQEVLFPLFVCVLLLSCCTNLSAEGEGYWRQIDRGLYVGKFKGEADDSGSPEIIVIKVDPAYYRLVLLCASQLKEKNMTVKQWCLKYKLIGGINAGMFQEDYKSNVGYMKNFAHLNNPRISSLYKSIAAFNPLGSDRPAFRIFDTDQTSVHDVIKSYATVIQNLRLIKRPAENRWNKEQNNEWCEAALGEDESGNALFIYCKKPYTMYELNEILLKLPIALVCAQHLEGGPMASLYFSHGGITLDFTGACAINVGAGSDSSYWAVPNVIGFRKRTDSK